MSLLKEQEVLFTLGTGPNITPNYEDSVRVSFKQCMNIECIVVCVDWEYSYVNQ